MSSHFTVFYGISQPVTSDDIDSLDRSLAWLPDFAQESPEERRLALDRREQEAQSWLPGFRFHPLVRDVYLVGLGGLLVETEEQRYRVFIGRHLAATGGKPGEAEPVVAVPDETLLAVMQQVKTGFQKLGLTDAPMLLAVQSFDWG